MVFVSFELLCVSASSSEELPVFQRDKGSLICLLKVRCFHSTLNLEDNNEETVSDATSNADATSNVDGEPENGKVYGYIDGRRDKNTDGLLYLGMIKLPEQLKESYKLFCKSMYWIITKLT